MSVRKAQAVLKSLVAMDLVEIVGKTGKGKPNHYVLAENLDEKLKLMQAQRKQEIKNQKTSKSQKTKNPS